MQKLITKYGLAAHLAFLAVAPLFLSPIPILYLSALAAIWVVMEPSRVGQEMLHDARKRVSGGLVADPLFWVCVALAIVAGVRALNDGVAMHYDAEIARWTIAEPAIATLPGSVAQTGLPLFAVAVAAIVIVAGCRHALGKSARYAFLLVASAFSGVSALIRIIVAHDNTAEIMRLTACDIVDPVYIGAAFGIFFLFSLFALTAIFERQWWRSVPAIVLAIVGNALALFLFAPATVTVLFGGAAVVILAYSFLYLRLKISKLADFKFLVIVGISLSLVYVIALEILPKEIFEAKTAPYMTGAFLTNEFSAVREALSRISLKIWKQNPWLGFGLGSFPIDLRFNALYSDWSIISSSQKAPLSGYWLLLTERGVIGAFFLAVPLVLMLVTYVHRLIFGLKTMPHPLACAAPLLLIVAALEMLTDCSFLAPSVMLPMFALLSLSAYAFPKEKQSHGR